MSFSQQPSKRPYLFAMFLLAALVLSFWLSAAAFARPAANPSASQPGATTAQDAFAHLVPESGAPPNPGSVNVGTKFTLDLKINTGSNNNVTAAQNYLTFDNSAAPNSVLKVLPSASASC